jgi:hypothetical protein
MMLSILRYTIRLGLSSLRKCSAFLVEISWHEREFISTLAGCGGGTLGPGGGAGGVTSSDAFENTDEDAAAPFFFLSEFFFLKTKIPSDEDMDFFDNGDGS